VGGNRWTITATDEGVRLDKFLAAAGRLESRGRAADAVQRGKVFVNEAEMSAQDAGRRLVPGDVVRVWMDRPGSARRRTTRSARPGELAIIYQDDVLVVVNKPPGLLAVPLPRRDAAPSVQQELDEHLRSRGRRRALVVHRIDRDTSGLVVFATRADAQARLKDQFRRREPERVYLAIVYGVPSPEQGSWHDTLLWDDNALIQRATHPKDARGKEARSEYRIIEAFPEASLLEVRLITGRRNQIRLQARLRGHTLIGEQRYVYGPESLRRIDFSRQALHAHRLRFTHPVSGRPLVFEAPLPSDMLALLSRLRSGPERP
jgi:23S rRNA pseudouridine1911/1915/1917 synthase